MIASQSQVAPLTKENIEQLHNSKTEGIEGRTRTRSEGDGESVDAISHHIENPRGSSGLSERKRRSSGVATNINDRRRSGSDAYNQKRRSSEALKDDNEQRRTSSRFNEQKRRLSEVKTKNTEHSSVFNEQKRRSSDSTTNHFAENRRSSLGTRKQNREFPLGKEKPATDNELPATKTREEHTQEEDTRENDTQFTGIREDDTQFSGIREDDTQIAETRDDDTQVAETREDDTQVVGIREVLKRSDGTRVGSNDNKHETGKGARNENLSKNDEIEVNKNENNAKQKSYNNANTQSKDIRLNQDDSRVKSEEDKEKSASHGASQIDETNENDERDIVQKEKQKNDDNVEHEGEVVREKARVIADNIQEEKEEEKKDDNDNDSDDDDDYDDEEEEEKEEDSGPNRPDNYKLYDSAEDFAYQTDNLQDAYDSADELREYENKFREEMRKAESSSSSESEEEPVTTSRVSSSMQDDESDEDDDDDDEEEEQPEEEEIDYEYITSAESEPSSIDTNYVASQSEDEQPQADVNDLLQQAIARELNDQVDDLKPEEQPEPEVEIADEGHETRPGTRLVSGQSASPHHDVEVESVAGSDRFDEFEGRLFESGECHFSTPVLFVEKDEQDTKSKTENEQTNKNQSKTRIYKKKRRRRKKELAKIKRRIFPLSDSENDAIDKTKQRKQSKKLNTRKRRENKKANGRNTSTHKVSFSGRENKDNGTRKRENEIDLLGKDDCFYSSSSVGPAETAFSSCSGEEWKILSSENTDLANQDCSANSPQYSRSATPVASQYSQSSSQDSSYFGSDYACSLSPPPIMKKVCWRIDGRMRHLPPIKKKVEAIRHKKATNKPKKKKKSLSASTRPPKTDDNSTMVKKILSANRNKITKLYNVVEELQQEVEHLRQENKTLKRITVKQERELKRVDREEGSLPQLLQRHSAELRTVRERLKKNKQEISRKEKESHGHDVELTKLRDKVHHYKELDNNKKLEERAALSKKLEKVENSLSEKDTKILELQKTIKLSEKARQREIKEQQDRYKKAKEELGKVQENVVSLREKLKEKEKQLDMTNIYHLNMQRKMKKVNPLALPSTHEEEIHTKNDFANSSLTEKKRVNIFLTNAVSDTSSNATADAAKIEHKSEVVVNERKNKNSFSEVDESLEFEKKQAARLKEEFEREERRRSEEETRREEEKLQEEYRQRKEEEELREKKRQLEEDKRRKEEQEKIENERKKREEEERIRKEKDEQARLKFKEDDEARRKKDLLLARMKAIDSTQGKPNGIIDIDLNTKNIDEKPKKLPIFLQSAAKESVTTNNKVTSDTEKQKFGSSNSVRSKHSKESSYDVKESFENLYQGLPAHPTDQHFRGRRNSQDDDPSFGSYKPTVTRRAEGSKKTEPTFGAYNPSFGDSRKDSGLDFGKKQDKKDKSKDVIFGSYEPTFGNAKTSNTITKDNDTPLDFSSKKSDGRRPRANQPNTIFGDDLFSNKPKRSSIINDDPFGSSNTSKDKNYPWEKKVNVAADKDGDSLLPRRPKLNQGPKQSVPAVGNMLNGTFDDDLEEVTL